MARRRELKSIASGFAFRCASRNNDISGYWGLGMIYRIAIQRGVNSISVDIGSDDDSGPEVNRFRRHFREKVAASSHGLYRFISGFVIDFKFEPYAVSAQRGVMARATCTVHIIDDLKKIRSASAKALCYAHDPRFELRSTRA